MMVRRHLVTIVLALVAVPTAAAPQLKPEAKKVPSLAGTSWAGQTAEGWSMTIDFAADGKMTYSYKGNSYTRASWKQEGDKVYWEKNDKYCEFNGKLAGDRIDGESHNVTGKKWATNLTRVRDR
jgi:hypothetical protein